MGPAESNPKPEYDGSEPHILADKSSHPTFWGHLTQTLSEKERLGLRRDMTVTESISPTKVRRNGVSAIQFGSNDYLGMAWNPAVIQAGRESLHATSRFGAGASPLVTGHSPTHAELAKAIARFESTESALFFSSGYAANVGTLSSLASKQDIVFSDRLNHASLIDGCRLSGARIEVYPHGDLIELRKLVRKNRYAARHAFVATDSVFSMDGDVARLNDIVALCEEFEMHCVLDEAHATGVYGHYGRGLAEHLNVATDRIIHIGTLSKAIGCVGGFVAGSKLLIDWLTNTARSWIYSTGTILPNAAAAIQSLELVSHMHTERADLAQKSIALRERLLALGLRVGLGDSPIVPVYLNDPQRVLDASRFLLDRGIYVPAIRPPTVPEGESLLRISLCVAHSEPEIEALIGAIAAFTL